MASIIASIQKGSITIADGSASNTATISSVTTANSICIFGGWRSTAISDGVFAYGRLSLTNSTTVTLTREGSASTGDLTVNYVVIEFESSAIDSIQQGTILLDDVTSNTATISSVTTGQSACFLQGQSATGSTGTEANILCTMELTDATTVTAAKTSEFSSLDVTAGYVVIEFDSTAVNSCQQFSITLSAATSGTATISSVTTSDSMIAWGGVRSATSDPDCFGHLVLTNSTTVTATHTGSNTSAHRGTVIEFASGVLNSVQRSSITVQNDATTNTATITSVDTDYAFANFTGFLTEGDDPDEQMLTLDLTNATTITATKGGTSTTSSDDGVIPYEAVEFVSGGGPTYTLTAGTGSFTLTGIATGLTASRNLAAGTGAFTLSGNAATLAKGRVLTAGTGSFTLTGNAAGLTASRVLAAGTGAFTLTGNPAGLSAGRQLSAGTGAFTLTGNAAGLQAGRALAAGTGAFTLTGIDADLIYTPFGGPTYTVVAGKGTFTLTGIDVGLSAGRKMAVEPGVFTLTGNDATLTYTPAGSSETRPVVIDRTFGRGRHPYGEDVLLREALKARDERKRKERLRQVMLDDEAVIVALLESDVLAA